MKLESNYDIIKIYKFGIYEGHYDINCTCANCNPELAYHVSEVL